MTISRVRYLTFFCGVWLVLTSCGDSTENTPKDIIPKQGMIEIIYDMGLTEAAYRGRKFDDTLAIEKVKQRLLFVYSDHGVNKEQFEMSYEYYLEHPEDLVEIYNEVLARYSVELANTEKQEN